MRRRRDIPVSRICPVCGREILELDGITVNAAIAPMVREEKRKGWNAIGMDGQWLSRMRTPQGEEEPEVYGHWLHDLHYREAGRCQR